MQHRVLGTTCLALAVCGIRCFATVHLHRSPAVEARGGGAPMSWASTGSSAITFADGLQDKDTTDVACHDMVDKNPGACRWRSIGRRRTPAELNGLMARSCMPTSLPLPPCGSGRRFSTIRTSASVRFHALRRRTTCFPMLQHRGSGVR